MSHGLYTIPADELMRLCRQAQERGCWKTAEMILGELARRGPAVNKEMAA